MANEKRPIDAMRLVTKLSKKVRFGRIEYDDVLAVIADAPTVDAVEVVHGEWVATCDPDIYQCGHCKKATKMDELCDSEILRAYCPNCGAKMDGDN